MLNYYGFPSVSFYFHAAYHGSDIYNCIAAIDKKMVKKYFIGNCKWISDGCGLVDVIKDLSSNFYSDHLDETPGPPKMWFEKKIKGIRSFHYLEYHIVENNNFIIDVWGKSACRWDIRKTKGARRRWIRSDK